MGVTELNKAAINPTCLSTTCRRSVFAIREQNVLRPVGDKGALLPLIVQEITHTPTKIVRPAQVQD